MCIISTSNSQRERITLINKTRRTILLLSLFRYLTNSSIIIGLSVLIFIPSSYALIAGENSGSDPDLPALRVDHNSCDSPWAGVVSIEINGGIYSGVTVGKQWILTAAHVVHGVQNTPNKINIHVPCNNIKGDTERVFIHPQYQLVTQQGIPLFDLALIRLSAPLPAAIPILPLNFQMMEQGTEAILIGYGASGNAGDKSLSPSSKTIKRRGENSLDTLLVDDKSRLLAYQYDFDGPNKSTNYLGGFTLGNQRETEVAPGDSGGPLFVMTTQNKPVLVGINTFRMSFSQNQFQHAPAPPDFGSGGGGIFLSSAADWLLRLVPDLSVDKTPINRFLAPTKSPH
jgi:hypothetical protein